MKNPHYDLEDQQVSSQELTKFQDALLFFLLVMVFGIIIWLFIPKVEYFHADPGSKTVYRQWTYGTVEMVTPDSTVIMGE
mgnify:CR=1 FL=1